MPGKSKKSTTSISNGRKQNQPKSRSGVNVPKPPSLFGVKVLRRDSKKSEFGPPSISEEQKELLKTLPTFTISAPVFNQAPKYRNTSITEADAEEKDKPAISDIDTLENNKTDTNENIHANVSGSIINSTVITTNEDGVPVKPEVEVSTPDTVGNSDSNKTADGTEINSNIEGNNGACGINSDNVMKLFTEADGEEKDKPAISHIDTLENNKTYNNENIHTNVTGNIINSTVITTNESGVPVKPEVEVGVEVIVSSEEESLKDEASGDEEFHEATADQPITTADVGTQYDSATISSSLIEGFNRRGLEKFDISKKQFIKKGLENNHLFYLAELVFKSQFNGEINVKIYGKDNLLTANKGNFVSRIRIKNQGNELDFGNSFEDVKSVFYSRIRIIKVLDDNFSDEKNVAYDLFKNILKSLLTFAMDNRRNLEDLLQLSEIFSRHSILLENTHLLKVIIKNNYLSLALKKTAEDFLKAEKNMSDRNSVLPKFDANIKPMAYDLYKYVKNICDEGIKKHKEVLLKQCPTNNFSLLLQLYDLNNLSMKHLLFLKSDDIKFFSDIHTIASQAYCEGETILQDFLCDLWKIFYKKIEKINKHKSLMEVGPLIHPIFTFLFKSFIELLLEIKSKTKMSFNSLIINTGKKFKFIENINWPESSPINTAIDQQCRLIFKLLKRFRPGVYLDNHFNYEYKLKDGDNKTIMQKIIDFFFGSNTANSTISEEHLVWLYILDCGLSCIMPDKSNENFNKLINSLFKGFVKLIRELEADRYESFRTVTHNITRFAAQISPYISVIGVDDGILNTLDHGILNKQIDIITNSFSASNSNVFDNFSDLIEVDFEYWKNRNLIVGNIIEKWSKEEKLFCKEFQEEINLGIVYKLLEIVDIALTKEVTIPIVIYFFRLYNEFLEHFKSLELNWLVCATSLPLLKETSLPFCQILNEEHKTYLVNNPEKFVEVLKVKKEAVPKHYFIEVCTELLNTVKLALSKDGWTDSSQLKAASDLLLAMGHSLPQFKDQADYVDFDNFVKACSLPFNNVLNSENLDEFKNRLGNVENFFLYTKKQNELDVDKTLEYCVNESKEAEAEGFTTNIVSSVLEKCHKRYSDKFLSLLNFKIPEIIPGMEKELVNVPRFDKWSPEFKQNVVPSLLASLACIWTLLESKDVAGIGKRIQPHCVQILCIFRLLGVDQEATGVDKHLCQVLTGQGKSIILGLLSALLAITGHIVYTACYSSYLATRDEQAFKAFFKHLSRFDVESNVTYATIDELANKLLSVTINGRKENLRSLVKKMVTNKLTNPIFSCDDKENKSILLLDEADVPFKKIFYPKTYSPVAIIGIDALLEIQPKIWEFVEEGIHEKEVILQNINEFINEFFKDGKYDDFKDILKVCGSFINEHLDYMTTCAINVSKAKDTHWYVEKFKLEDDYIMFRDYNDQYKTNVYDSYYNVFNYFRLKNDKDFDDKSFTNYGYINADCGHIAYAYLIKEYPLILGVSGTLTKLNEYEKSALKSYDINSMTVMPSFFGKTKLKFKPGLHCTIAESEEIWTDKISLQIEKIVNCGRAVIVFFENIKEMNKFEEKIRRKVNRLHILTGNENPDMLLEYINEAGLGGTVTLAIQAMGRGVDFKSNDLSVEKLGGTHVIVTHFPMDVNAENQYRGRTARNTNEGSFELIVCRTHLEKLGVSKTAEGKSIISYKQLCDIRKVKADLEIATIQEEVKKSAEKHNLTMAFLKSFYQYSPNKREAYFSSYPFVKPKEEEK